MDVERLLGDATQRRLVSLPAEGPDGQIAIDALDAAGVEGAVGLGGDAAEGDALGRQVALDAAAFRTGARARRGRLGAELGAHLARQRRDRTDAEEMRRIALVRARDPLAVAAEERVLGLRPGAVGSALRVTAEAPERVGAARGAAMHPPQLRREVDRLAVGTAAPPAVLRAEQVAEELVADGEERVGAERVVIEVDVGERRVLDQLARLARVEHAVEVLATAELDRLLELLAQDRVVGERAVVDVEHRAAIERVARARRAVARGVLSPRRRLASRVLCAQRAREGDDGDHDGAAEHRDPSRRSRSLRCLASHSHGRVF